MSGFVQRRLFLEGQGLALNRPGPASLNRHGPASLNRHGPASLNRHGPARPGHLFRHSADAGGPDEPGHDGCDEPGHDGCREADRGERGMSGHDDCRCATSGAR